MGITLTFFYGLLGICFLVNGRGRLANPIVIFFFIWAAIFFLYEFRFWLPDSYDLSGYGIEIFYFYLLIGVATACGGLCSILFQNWLPKKKVWRAGFIQQEIELNSYNPVLAKILAYLSFFLALIAVAQAPYGIKEYFSIGGQIRSAMSLAYDPLSSLASMLSGYAGYLAVVPSLIVLLSDRRTELWPYLTIAAFFIIAFISIAKYTIIQLVVLGVAVYVIKKNINIRNILRLTKNLLFLLLIVGVLFWAVDSLRNNEQDDEDRGVVAQVGSIMYMYGVGHVNTFAIFMSNRDDAGASTTKNAGFSNYSSSDEPAFGERTFSSVYRILYWLNLRESLAYTRYEGVKGFNTASIYRPLIDDFGIHGAYVSMFVFGFIIQLLSRLTRKLTPFNISISSFIFMFIIFTPIHSLFNFIYFILCLFCAGFVARDFRTNNRRVSYARLKGHSHD